MSAFHFDETRSSRKITPKVGEFQMGLVRAAAGIFSVLMVGLLSGCGSDGSKGSDSDSISVRINELQPSNQTTITDENDEADDWIEFYNTGDTDVDLAGYFLSDDSADLEKFTFTTNAVVPAGGVLLVWADGVDQTTQGPLHVGFKLSASGGDRVMLTSPDGYVVDQITFDIPPGAQYSYGRFPDGTGEFEWCATATPKAANGNACQ
jgi:hypothetical protein